MVVLETMRARQAQVYVSLLATGSWVAVGSGLACGGCLHKQWVVLDRSALCSPKMCMC